MGPETLHPTITHCIEKYNHWIAQAKEANLYANWAESLRADIKSTSDPAFYDNICVILRVYPKSYKAAVEDLTTIAQKLGKYVIWKNPQANTITYNFGGHIEVDMCFLETSQCKFKLKETIEVTRTETQSVYEFSCDGEDSNILTQISSEEESNDSD